MVLVLIAAASSVMAEEKWELFFKGTDKSYYIDKATISLQPGNIVRFREKIEHQDNDAYDNVLIEVNCSERSWRMLSIAIYDREGNIKSTCNNPTDWIAAKPGKVGEAIYNAVCK